MRFIRIILMCVYKYIIGFETTTTIKKKCHQKFCLYVITTEIDLAVELSQFVAMYYCMKILQNEQNHYSNDSIKLSILYYKIRFFGFRFSNLKKSNNKCNLFIL